MKHMRFRNVLGGMLFCLLAFGSTHAKAQSDPNAVFATVNGEEIKSGEFWHRLAWFRVDTTSPLARLPAGFLTVNQLITEHIVYGLARDKGCAPSDPEIQALLKQKESDDPTLVTDMKNDGRPESDIYAELKYDLALYKLHTFGITITDQEVEQHYRDYPTEFTRPKQYKVAVIIVDSDQTASTVDQALAGGKSFSDTAKAYSLDLSKSNGGEYGTVSVNQLAATAVNALNTTKIGQTTDWVTGSQGNQVKVKYLLENIVPPSVTPLDDHLKNEIRQKLSLAKGDVKNQVVDDLQKATINAKVTINQAGFQKIYDQMIVAYKKTHPGS